MTHLQHDPAIALVTREQTEGLLASVGDELRDSRAGLFGPESVSWQVKRESALFLAAGRAALLQLAHPWVATSLSHHSNILSDPIGRFHNTFRVIFTMVFGAAGQAFAAARGLHALHTRIRGELPETVARYNAGSHYEANELSALCWVHATLVESSLLAYEFVLPPLTSEQRETYYAENKRMAALFGIPPEALPSDWTAFERYNREMADSDALGVNEYSRAMGHRILTGTGSWIRPPRWYRALTTWWMPPRLRYAFALEFDARDQRALERARRWLPRIYPRIPAGLRYVGPFHEAQSRLRGAHGPGLLTQASNRFWMGQRRMLFPEHAKGD